MNRDQLEALAAQRRVARYEMSVAELRAQAEPSCPTCHGSGVDEAFGCPCECERFVGTTGDLGERLREMAGAEGNYNRKTDKAWSPGDRLDGRTFGTGGSPKQASEAQWRKIDGLIRRLAGTPGATEAIEVTGWANGDFSTPMTTREASAVIEQLLAAEAALDSPASPAEAPVRTNRYWGDCEACGRRVRPGEGRLERDGGRWVTTCLNGCDASGPAVAPGGLDLRHLPSGRYAVPGGDSRLKVKIDVVTEGTWAGYVFVKDAAEYGYGKKYGRQRPGQAYSGEIEAELRVIAADPRAAAIAYTALVGRCSVCHRKLEKETSVEQGMGPTCLGRFQ